eukprot:g50374.t1
MQAQEIEIARWFYNWRVKASPATKASTEQGQWQRNGKLANNGRDWQGSLFANYCTGLVSRLLKLWYEDADRIATIQDVQLLSVLFETFNPPRGSLSQLHTAPQDDTYRALLLLEDLDEGGVHLQVQPKIGKKDSQELAGPIKAPAGSLVLLRGDVKRRFPRRSPDVPPTFARGPWGALLDVKLQPVARRSLSEEGGGTLLSVGDGTEETKEVAEEGGETLLSVGDGEQRAARVACPPRDMPVGPTPGPIDPTTTVNEEDNSWLRRRDQSKRRKTGLASAPRNAGAGLPCKDLPESVPRLIFLLLKTIFLFPYQNLSTSKQGKEPRHFVHREQYKDLPEPSTVSNKTHYAGSLAVPLPTGHGVETRVQFAQGCNALVELYVQPAVPPTGPFARAQYDELALGGLCADALHNTAENVWAVINNTYSNQYGTTNRPNSFMSYQMPASYNDTKGDVVLRHRWSRPCSNWSNVDTYLVIDLVRYNMYEGDCMQIEIGTPFELEKSAVVAPACDCTEGACPHFPVNYSSSQASNGYLVYSGCANAPPPTTSAAPPTTSNVPPPTTTAALPPALLPTSTYNGSTVPVESAAVKTLTRSITSSALTMSTVTILLSQSYLYPFPLLS